MMKKTCTLLKICIGVVCCGLTLNVNACITDFSEISFPDSATTSPANKHQIEVFTPTIYPNPAVHTLNVEAKNMKQIEIIDMLGKILIKNDDCSGHEQINISDLKEGLYFIRVFTTDNRTSVTKFIKK